MQKRRVPGYGLHKPSGQAYVRINGKDHYLGPYDSRESRDRYDELIRESTVNQSADGVTLTIDELALRYLLHARQHYSKNGEETSEVSSIRSALRIVVEIAGPRTSFETPRQPRSVASSVWKLRRCCLAMPALT